MLTAPASILKLARSSSSARSASIHESAPQAAWTRSRERSHSSRGGRTDGENRFDEASEGFDGDGVSTGTAHSSRRSTFALKSERARRALPAEARPSLNASRVQAGIIESIIRTAGMHFLSFDQNGALIASMGQRAAQWALLLENACSA